MADELRFQEKLPTSMGSKLRQTKFSLPQNQPDTFLLRPVTMKGQKFIFPKIPAKLCLNGRLWAQFGRFFFRNFQEFRKSTISRGDLGQHRPEKFSSRSWIRRGVISCSPHTSFDEINDSVVNSERD